MTSRVSPHAVCATLETGAVVLHMGTRRYFTLNETGAYIWSLLDQGCGGAEIVTRLCDTFAVSLDDAQAALARLLAELESEQLLSEPSAG